MKKKLFLLIIVLVAAAILVSGCSTDSLKERVPGVKANVNMLLADNDEGDLEYEVGEVKTEEDFSDENEDPFGTQIIEDIEEEIKGVSESKEILEDTDDFPQLPTGTSGTVNGSTTISISTDQAQKLESINFSAGKLVIDVSTSTTASTVNSITIDGKSATITGNKAEVELKNGPDLTKNNLGISYEVEIDDLNNFNKINFNLNFSSDILIDNLRVDLGEFDVASSGYDLKMTETLIEDYEKEDFVDALTVSDSEMHINFDIAEGINLDLSGVDVKSDPEDTDYTFPLADEYLTSENSKAMLDLNKIFLMLQDDNTTDVLIAGNIALSSDGVITITKASELGVKNAVLQSAELKIDNYQMDPEAAEEGLSSNEVSDIKKGLEDIELNIEGIKNELPASMDLKFYVKDGAGTKAELYKEENKLTTLSLKANTTDASETIIINKDQFDKFIGNDIYVGLELYSDIEFTKEEYENKLISVEQVKTQFNLDLDIDDFE